MDHEQSYHWEHPGSLISFKFSTDVAIAALSSLSVQVDGPFFDQTFVAAEGQASNLCSVSGSSVATSTLPVSGNLNLSITFITDLKIGDIITCTYRIYTQPSASTFTITFTDPTVLVVPANNASAVLTVFKAPPTIIITSASSTDFSSTDVTIKFGALSASTLYGPLTTGYTFKSGVQTASLISIFTSDFNAVFGTGVRLVFVDDVLWLLTDATVPTDASVSLEYSGWNSYSSDEGSIYSVWASLDVYDTKVTGSKDVGIVPSSDYSYPSIQYSEKSINYSMVVTKNTVTNPTFKFSIDKYSTDIVFGTGSSLSYTVDGAAPTSLDTTSKSFSYDLTAAVGTSITVSGSFPVTTLELASINASIGGQSGSGKIFVMVYPGKLTIGSAVSADNVLSYTFTIISDLTDYTGSIDYDFQSSISYRPINGGDIRALDAYSPQCTSDLGKVSVGDKITQGNFDTNLIPIFTSGSLQSGSTIHTITCTQKLHASPKSKTVYVFLDNEITATISASQDMTWTVPATTLYNQKVIIQGTSITSDADMNALIAKVTALFVANWNTKDDMIATDYVYHYVGPSTVQHYAANQAGLALDFTNPMVQHWSKAGSLLTLAFTRNAGITTAYTQTFYGGDFWVNIFGDNDTPTTLGLTAVAAFVDGSVLPGYELSTSIGNGYGFKCATSAQCNSQVCLSGVCSETAQLTRSQQGGGDSSSSASNIFTILSLVITMLALFL